MKPLTCNRCGYQWMPRKPHKPVVCAKCKRADWNSKPKPVAELANSGGK